MAKGAVLIFGLGVDSSPPSLSCRERQVIVLSAKVIPLHKGPLVHGVACVRWLIISK